MGEGILGRFRVEDYLHGSGSKSFGDSLVGAVTLAGKGEGSVKYGLVAVGIRGADTYFGDESPSACGGE